MSERKPIIPHILVSGLAGAALIALWIGNPLASTDDTGTEPAAERSEASEVVAPQVAAAAEAAPEVRLAVATTRVDTTRVDTTVEVPTVAATQEAPAPEVTLVDVPDVGRMSAWEARKQLKKRGLGFSFKDGRRRVHHEDYDFYRVRKQSLAAGTRVAPGTKVTMQVRERQFASGY